MKLKYDNISDVAINPLVGVSLNSLNNSLNKLLTNDLMLKDVAKYSPKIWECKWYNDSAIQGYPKGYAVWYNTEDPEQFIAANADIIYNYAINNSFLRSLMKETGEYNGRNFDVYLSVLNGYSIPSNGMSLPPVFDIGVLSNDVQIKISLKDNNKDPLSSSSWENFIVNDTVDLETRISNIISAVYDDHIDYYHGGKYALNTDILQNYTDLYLENITNKQKWTSHVIPKKTSGLDYVIKEVRKPVTVTIHDKTIKAEGENYVWKVKNYENITTDGVLSDKAKSEYKELLKNCNNYTISKIENQIDNLTDDVPANISYTAISSSVTPVYTNDYSLISSNIDAYNCSFDLIPLSTNISTEVEANINLYNKIRLNDVQTYNSVTYTTYKWFRLWKSGYLEHGGIFECNNVGLNTVKLNWTYSINDSNTLAVAPVYDYQNVRIPFYKNHNILNTETGDIITNDTLDIGYDNRYNVQLTPIKNDIYTYLSGNSESYPKNPDNNGNYMVADVVQMKNDSFGIYIDNAENFTRYWSYYVCGFYLGGAV